MDYSLYLHIPFCRTKCGYCDFFSLPNATESLRVDFGEALITEIQRAISEPPFIHGRIRSLYLGGGTPSLMSPSFFEELLGTSSVLRPHLLPDAEITVEANPESFSQDLASCLADLGVTRISLGLQSFDLANLAFLERQHEPKHTQRAIELVRRYPTLDLSLDLMTQFPGQSPDDVVRELRQLIAFEAEHLSVYGLGWEPGTPLDNARLKGKHTPLPSDRAADLFLLVSDHLSRAGYLNYEVSNFALPTKAARHNSGYWMGAPTLGVGPGAVSQLQAPFARWQTPRDLEAFMTHVRKGEAPARLEDQPDSEALLLERLYLGLRWAGGISFDELEGEFPVSRLEAIRRRSCQGKLGAAFDRGQAGIDFRESLFPTGFYTPSSSSKRLRLLPEDWLLLDEFVIELTR
jgi:oxygen-independent coproporphyrinogen III oxidase